MSLRSKIMDRAQLVAVLAVIVGLVLVVFELRQAQELARAQMIADQYAQIIQHRNTVMGENPARSMDKACSAPDSLSTEDVEVLVNYYFSLHTLVDRIRGVAETGYHYENEEYEQMSVFYRQILDTHFGRFWWTDMRVGLETYNPKMYETMTRMYEEVKDEPPRCRSRLDRYQKYLGQQD